MSLTGQLGDLLSTALEDISGPGGVLDDLLNSPDPLGLVGAAGDGKTVLGDIFGNSGVLDDLTSADGGTVGEVLKDIAGPGGILSDLTNNDGLGVGHLLGEGTVLENLVGDGGTVDHALSLLF
ncbi:hypothetical protein ACIKT0_07750 [Hansschlegelia beijingensis]|uniref:hypothetical protein n=1 Tax=Hansschlegelia beijingensis TaxID=1133344 RepID=UPI00387F0CFF